MDSTMLIIILYSQRNLEAGVILRELRLLGTNSYMQWDMNIVKE